MAQQPALAAINSPTRPVSENEFAHAETKPAPAGAIPDLNSPTGRTAQHYEYGADKAGSSSAGNGQAPQTPPQPTRGSAPPAHALAGIITQADASGKQQTAGHTSAAAAGGGKPAASADSTPHSRRRKGGSCFCCSGADAEEPGQEPTTPTEDNVTHASTPQQTPSSGGNAPPTPNARYPNSPTHHGFSKAHGKGDATPTPMKARQARNFPDGPLDHQTKPGLLSPMPAGDKDEGRICLVLDLDETLVHSSFEPVPNADYVIPVEIDNVLYNVYVCKRPGCDDFMKRVGEKFEVVVFTASLAKYANPLLDQLDIHKVVRHRLFREACVYHHGSYVKDMTLMGRDIRKTILVDNSPASYQFQPENALPCSSFIDQMDDKELWEIADFLDTIADCRDVREDLPRWPIPEGH